MKRRNRLKRLHTATHIVNYCSRQVLGNHIWQNGSNLKPEYGTLDITHYDKLTRDEIARIEYLANETIFQDKKVGVEELERTQAEKKYGFELYQGGAIPMKTIRIIHVEDSDIEACGGLHVFSTGDIGMIKITDAQKIQDGVIRLTYVVREFALEFIETQQRMLENSAQVFSVQKEQLQSTSEKFFNSWRNQKKEIEKLTDSLKNLAISSILSSTETEFSLPLTDMGSLVEVMGEVLKEKKSCKLITQKFIAATPDIEVGTYKKKLDKEHFSIYIL